ncbi:hypothetical protein PGT21_028730 [Puccinia graminis f. sp. tritici]|uniref:HAT C-terminal dimerisation domain-containing protein n=1 Tax=Puccinia graminis f. sp. tritici TaxID=56615 RepID=A0A5B0S4B6_PUCGR|nr:hypothetical protein PGT21_004791 [Puccinia graminis f. sp. tritici]KAA1084472.1 hypothetical protein PGT21_028730 [Puccinia graminis f. sp. tritici]KAA1133016.1 hypothetical protein PGTUg99_022637 [Puccinia graminis f. sp. tritici]
MGRVDPPKTRNPPGCGSGLGRSVVKKLISDPTRKDPAPQLGRVWAGCLPIGSTRKPGLRGKLSTQALSRWSDAFSTGGRVLSDHRTRLRPDTLEALVCTQNWICGDVGIIADNEDTDAEEEVK